MVDYSKTREWAAAVAELEKEAGISDSIEEAKLGPFIPDFEATNEEYFDGVADHLRNKARTLYFAIENVDLRIQLIHSRRQEHQAYIDLQQASLAESLQSLEKAKRGAEWKPWLIAAAMAVLCVVLGARYFDLFGAIAGAVGGIFVGFATSASIRRDQAHEIRMAEDEVKEARERLRDGQLNPDWFNAEEERTGTRDPSFDDENVMANRAQLAMKGEADD